ncbi:MAG: proton-conducting transporter membrane subunit [Anaerolineae bacterium]
MDSSLAIINAIPFLLALLMAIQPLTASLKKTGLAWLTSGIMAVLFVWLLTFLPRVEEESVIQLVWEWVPDLGLTLSWYLDGLSLMFGLVVTGIGVAVYLYAGYYLDSDEEAARFYTLLAAFTGAMLALVMAGNILTLFIAWELTSVISFLLIGFKGDKYEAARTGASRALVITGGGGLALLVGLLLMGTATGSFEMADILANTELVDHPWYAALTILIMLGAFTKSAQFPFHFWLPGGMSAPSPASAYLHSATMVKAGVYLLFRFYPTLGNTPLWQNGLMTIGLITMFIGALFAIRQRDLKGLLAYSTISKLGALVALIGLPESIGLKAALVGILAHALYKGTFFLLAGTVEHSTGTRNLDELGGLRRLMPSTFWIAAAVGLSMAGYPPFLGFVAKEVLLDANLPEHGIGVLPIIIVTVASILTAVTALLFVWDVFVSRADREYHHYHAPSFGLNLGPALLAVASLLTALLLDQTIIPLIDPALTKEFSLYLIPHEINLAVILSVVILIVSPLVFMVRGLWLNMPWINITSGAEIYARIIAGVEWFGDVLLRLQGGRLRYYLIAIMGVVAGLMLLGGYDNLRGLNIELTNGSTDVLNIVLLALTVGATLAAIVLREHLLAALAMGVSGYAIGGIFLLEPAPDVALVQFLVETLATVLIILMIARIRTDRREEAMQVLWKGLRENNNWGIWRDIAISTVIGVSVGLFTLAAVNDREARIADMVDRSQFITHPIALWHLENAYPEIGIPDVVSAVVTDFRGSDTLLEITVFSFAALGVLTLLTLPEGRELLTGRSVTQVMKRVATQSSQRAVQEMQTTTAANAPAEGGTGSPEVIAVIDTNGANNGAPIEETPQFSTPDEYGAWGDSHDAPRLSTPLTRTIATLLLPFAFILSLSQVFYGGEGPGDGFTAGVVSGLAVASWYVIFGYYETRARLRWLYPGRLITVGLLLGLSNAIAGMIFSNGFLAIYEINNGYGPAGIHLASTLLFEISIYLAVFGGVTTIMEAIAHPEDVEVDV